MAPQAALIWLGRVVSVQDGLQTRPGFGTQLVAGTQQPAVRPGRIDLAGVRRGMAGSSPGRMVGGVTVYARVREVRADDEPRGRLRVSDGGRKMRDQDRARLETNH